MYTSYNACFHVSVLVVSQGICIQWVLIDLTVCKFSTKNHNTRAISYIEYYLSASTHSTGSYNPSRLSEECLYSFWVSKICLFHSCITFFFVCLQKCVCGEGWEEKAILQFCESIREQNTHLRGNVAVAPVTLSQPYFNVWCDAHHIAASTWELFLAWNAGSLQIKGKCQQMLHDFWTWLVEFLGLSLLSPRKMKHSPSPVP